MASRALVIGAGLVAVVLVGYGVMEFRDSRQKNVAAATAWQVDGPPCPTTTKAEYEAKGYRIRHNSTYTGVHLGRQAGHLACKEVKSKGGVGFGSQITCQLTAPAVLTVKVGDVENAYLPGPGQPATIVVHKKQVSCVLGGDTTMSLR